MLQLRTGIRLESLQVPLKKAIDLAARLEFDSVEINTRTQLRHEDLTRTAIRHLNKILSDRNLSVCSLSFPTRRPFYNLDDLDRRLEATRNVMSMAFEVGSRLVTGTSTQVPDPQDHPEQYQTLVAALTDLARHGQRVGCEFRLQSMLRT